MCVCVFVCMCKANKTNKVIAENKRRQGRKKIKQTTKQHKTCNKQNKQTAKTSRNKQQN